MAISVNSVSTTNNAATSQQTPNSDSVGLGDDLNAFLTMLTTQLKNQDPMSPLDTNQFTQQLVSFSQVEQAIKTNTQLQSLVSLSSASNLTTSVGLIGVKIEVDSPEMTIADGGGADFSYTLPATSKNTSLIVSDASGKIVWQGTGETSAGKHDFTWDGKDNNGNALPAGTYTLEASGQGLDDAVLTVPVTAYGVPDGVLMKDGSGSFTFGDLEVSTSKLVSVHA